MHDHSAQLWQPSGRERKAAPDHSMRVSMMSAPPPSSNERDELHAEAVGIR